MTQTFTFASDDHVFVAAAIAAADDYFFVAHDASLLENGNYATRLLRRKAGVWSQLAAWPWQSVGLAIASNAPLRVEVLGRDGEVGVLQGDAISAELLEPGTALGPMRDIGIVFGRVMAWGMQRHVFVRDAQGRWIRFDKGMAQELVSATLDIDALIGKSIKSGGGINGIVSQGDDRLLAFGMRGEIWRYLKDRWEPMDSPTNVMLKDAVNGPDGDIFVCGLRGTLLRGRDDQWQQLDYEGEPRLGFCSIDTFGGAIYVADGHSLRVLVGDQLKVIDFGVEEVVPCMQVTANAGEVMSVAGQEVWVSRDGTQWTCLVG
ncbi:hypothetical protein [Rhizobacter sp. P5_C2]